MNKWIFPLVLLIVCCVQVGFLIQQVLQYEDTRTNGVEYHFAVGPRDPLDPFRGRYMALNFRAENSNFTNASPMLVFDIQNRTNSPSGSKNYAYLTFTTNTNGLAEIARVYASAPKETDNFLKVEWLYGNVSLDNSSNVSMRVKFPFERYYMSERIADQADAAVRVSRSMSDTETTYLAVRIKNGRAVPEELYVNGMPLAQFIKSAK